MSIDYFSAFVIGLLGSGHCLSMCGGVTSMLVSAMPNAKTKPKLSFILSYNIGRILSYALLGAIAGLSGSLAIHSLGFPLSILRIIASLFLILLGLYLAQWLMILVHFEKIGKSLWQYVSPLSKKVIPVNSAAKALALGGIWGWLPCGLVYSTLTWSVASGGAFEGAFIMFAFGLGTIPALFTLSYGYFSLNHLIKNLVFRQVMGILLISYGFYGLYLASATLF